MRRLRLPLLMLFILLVVPLTAFAQDQKLAWELNVNTYLDVKDLGFRFYYPSGWVYNADNGNGVALAAVQADVDAQIDDSDSTQPTGLTMAIHGIPLSALTDLGANPTLDAIVDYVVKSGEITEAQRAEIPIMTRRSISVFGTNKNGRAGIASMWLQNGYLILASLGAPDPQTINDLAYTWGATIGSIAPLDAQTLSKDLLSDESSHFTINYPDGWTSDPNHPAVIYENADEVGQGVTNVKGKVFTFSDAALSDLQLKDDATLADVVTKVKAAFDLDDTVTSEEFVLLGQPAVTLSGEPSSSSQGAGHGVMVTTGLVNGRAIVLIVVTPSKDAITAFMPTWIAMLTSITSTEPAQ
ncbi:MAG: hypothetical protein ABI690_14735 [Chloroflexota bacterium]